MPTGASRFVVKDGLQDKSGSDVPHEAESAGRNVRQPLAAPEDEGQDHHLDEPSPPSSRQGPHHSTPVAPAGK